jgi:membrane protease YdiL (CAAX protease family)
VFLVASIVFSFIPTSVASGFMGSISTKALGYGVLHSFVIAYGEELVFRGLFSKFLGGVWSSILFGLFHFGITGYVIKSVLALILLLGLPAYYISKKVGLLGAVGYHFAWNMKAMGILDIVLKGMGVMI